MSVLKSSIGRKYVMGIAGLIWTGFVFTHMAANILIINWPQAYNLYSYTLTSNKPLLYTAEAILVLSLLVHAGLGIYLTIQNKKASPAKYKMGAKKDKKATWASRTMAIHGSIILVFVIYHLNTFKYGKIYSVVYDGVEMRDLHRLVLEVFQEPGYVIGYTICMILLGFHLSHGFGSVFQSLGLNHPKYTPIVKKLSILYAVVVAGGFAIPPIYVFLN